MEIRMNFRRHKRQNTRLVSVTAQPIIRANRPSTLGNDPANQNLIVTTEKNMTKVIAFAFDFIYFKNVKKLLKTYL